jgi:hypothetical protein
VATTPLANPAPEQKLDVATGQSKPVADNPNWLTDWWTDLHN